MCFLWPTMYFEINLYSPLFKNWKILCCRFPCSLESSLDLMPLGPRSYMATPGWTWAGTVNSVPAGPTSSVSSGWPNTGSHVRCVILACSPCPAQRPVIMFLPGPQHKRLLHPAVCSMNRLGAPAFSPERDKIPGLRRPQGLGVGHGQRQEMIVHRSPGPAHCSPHCTHSPGLGLCFVLLPVTLSPPSWA